MLRLGIFIVAVASFVGCGRTGPEPEPTPAVSPPVYTPRPLRELTVLRTLERVARGQYLVEGLLQCPVCHSERDMTKPGGPPVAGLKLAGQVWPGRPWLVAPNLTPDNETGIGSWTDDMLVRAIREGISHDGRVLHEQMWYAAFRILSDEDVEAVVAYLRSLAPIRHALPKTTIPVEQATDLSVPEPITAPVPPMAAATAIEHGRQLAHLADCGGCHTSWYTPKNPGLFGGGNLITRGNAKAYSANITSDDSGLAHYDAAFFREVLRTGAARGRVLSPLMPWIIFRHLNDEDLNALFAYLQALPKVKHLIDNINPVATCRICGGEHPLGDYNRPVELKLVPVPVSAMRDVVGTYRFEDGFTLRIVIDQGTLQIRFDDGKGCALVTEDRRLYICRDDIDRIEFTRDATGKVTGLTSNLDPAIKMR